MMKTDVTLEWAEELVESPSAFYVRMKPVISFKTVGVEAMRNSVAARALIRLRQVAKEKK